MRKRDNPEAWKELLKSMSQGEWQKAKQIVKDNDFYPDERDKMWRNIWIVTTKDGEILEFRTAKEVAKELRTSQSTVIKARKAGETIRRGPLEGYTIMRVKNPRKDVG